MRPDRRIDPPTHRGPARFITTMQRQPLLPIFLPLAVTTLLSWAILPFLVPSFGPYSFSELLEVLLWQGMGAVGWPLALFGIALSLPFDLRLSGDYSFLFILIYPAIEFLLLSCVISRTQRRLELVFMHLLVTFSFALVWYHVSNGYNFMSG